MQSIKIPKHIEELKGYKPGKDIDEIKKELGLKQTAVLWNNENNLGPSPKAIEEIQKVLKTSHLYPDPTASLLRAEIAKVESISPNQIVVGNGSEAILSNIFQAFFEEDDELLTSEGTFVAVYIWAKSYNRAYHTVPLDDSYAYDLEAIAKSITPKTKLIYLANPNNPTGTVFSKEAFKDFMKKVPSDVLVISDEAYYEYARVLSDDFPSSIQLNYPNVIALRTFSKGYGIASVRIGYAMGPANLIEVLQKVKMTFEPSNIAQAAGIGAIRDQEYLQRTIANNSEGLDLFYSLFDSLGIRYIKSFANFVTIVMESQEQVQDLSDKLLKKGVFVRPLKAFGLPHCMRITVGLPEENELFAKSLRELY